jgi:CRP-like cAMP-binding protein
MILRCPKRTKNNKTNNHSGIITTTTTTNQSIGEQGNVCYFIKEGEVECTKIGDTSLGSIVIGPESYFGERALLTDEPRAADVTAKSACVLMALDRNAFIELLGPLRAVMDENMKTRVMQAVPILSQFSDSQRTKMVEKFKLIKFGNGDVIVKEGDEGDRFYIVRSGSVTVEREKRVLATLNAGMYVFIYGYMDGWMDGWMDGYMVGRMDELMNEWMNECIDVGWIYELTFNLYSFAGYDYRNVIFPRNICFVDNGLGYVTSLLFICSGRHTS